MDLNQVMNFAAPLLGGGMQALNGAAGAQGPGGSNQANGAQGGMAMAMQMMPQAMQMMQMIMQAVTMMGSQLGAASGGVPSFGGIGGMNSGLGDFLGGGATPSFGGGATPSFGGGGGMSAMPASFGGATGTGGVAEMSGTGGGGDTAKAVEIARQYMGQRTGGIQGLPQFTRNGQDNNNCAEFVSACLDKAGAYKKQPGDASVATLAQNLQKQGWKKVSKEQTKPGDVAVFNKSQHVELVSQPGGKELIGSNNKGSVQYVGTDQGNWGNIEYYSKG